MTFSQCLPVFAEINAVADGLAHFGFAVNAGEAEAGFVGGKNDFRFYQCFAVNIIKFADDFPCLFQHRFLVFPYRHGGGVKGGDVSSLADGVAEETGRNAGFKMFLLDFCFYSGVSFQPGNGDQVHVVHGQFRKRRYQGLDEDIGFIGINAYGEVVQGYLEHILPYFFRVVRIVCEGLGIGDFNVDFIKFAGILQGCPFAEGAYVVAYVKVSGRTVTG